MASGVELLPVYDFVRDGGRAEPFRHDVPALSHGGTGRPAMQIIEVLRNGLLRENVLEQWLSGHPGRHYHFLAATGSPTAVAYEKRRGPHRYGARRRRTRASGQRPTSSCRSAHVHVTTLPAGGLGHQRLCERPDVQEYCLAALGDAHGGARPGTVVATAPRQPALHPAARRRLPGDGAARSWPGPGCPGKAGRRAVGHPSWKLPADPWWIPERSRRPTRSADAWSARPLTFPSRDVFEVDSPRSGRFRTS